MAFNKNIKPKQFFYFTLIFIFIVPLSTMYHEFGHFAMAKILGYETTIHYSKTIWTNQDRLNFEKLYQENKSEIENDLEFQERVKYVRIVEKLDADNLLILSSGIILTNVTGVIAFLFLFCRKKNKNINIVDFIYIFLSFFLIRQIYILLYGIFNSLFTGKVSFLGDEAIVSKLLRIPNGTISLPLGLITVFIFLYILLKIIPRKLFSTFIISGIIGGSFGFIFWMFYLGPKILS